MIYAEKAWNQNTQRLRLSMTDKLNQIWLIIKTNKIKPIDWTILLTIQNGRLWSARQTDTFPFWTKTLIWWDYYEFTWNVLHGNIFMTRGISSNESWFFLNFDLRQVILRFYRKSLLFLDQLELTHNKPRLVHHAAAEHGYVPAC